MPHVYKYRPTYRVTLASFSTRESKLQMVLAKGSIEALITESLYAHNYAVLLYKACHGNGQQRESPKTAAKWLLNSLTHTQVLYTTFCSKLVNHQKCYCSVLFWYTSTWHSCSSLRLSDVRESVRPLHAWS